MTTVSDERVDQAREIVYKHREQICERLADYLSVDVEPEYGWPYYREGSEWLPVEPEAIIGCPIEG